MSRRVLRAFLRLGYAASAALFLVFMVQFVQSNSANAIARGYTTTDTGLKVGMVAALTSSDSDESQVERATQENIRQIVGVVTNLDDSLVTVASSNAKVLVDTEGQVKAYVSDMGGPVTKGGLLTISSVKGVLMQVPAQSGASIIAIASEPFNAGAESTSYEIDGENDQKQIVKIGKIQVNLNRSGSGGGSSSGDSSLSRLGQALVGKQVSEIRVVIALILFLVVLLVEGAIIYGAISSAITALGRNPLARNTIRREMLKIISVALVVFAIGLAAIYGILWV